MIHRLASSLLVLLVAGPLLAQPASQTSVRPAAYIFGTTEQGAGSAYEPPNDSPGRDHAASLGLGLDASRAFDGGKVDGSVFALAHDPLSGADRGYFAAGRIRASLGDGPWIFRVEDAFRFQRRRVVGLADFQRNEVSLEVERRTTGPGFGVRVVDRRRSLPDDADGGFDRQSFLGFLGGTTPRGAWRLEAGPQRYATAAADGWRLVAAAEIVRLLGGTTAALRIAWTAPFDGAGGGRTSGDLYPTASPSPIPSPSPTPVPLPDPLPPRDPVPPLDPEPVGNAPPPENVVAPVPPESSMSPSPAPSLLGPALVVDALDGDEGDWDFGRRKQAFILFVSRRLTKGSVLSLEASHQRERGEDLLAPGQVVSRDRSAARLSLRRTLGAHAAFIVQGGIRRVRDDRPYSSYTWGMASIGLELRP